MYNRGVHHTKRFMVIEICRNMLLRGLKTTLEHARDELSFHILRVTYNRVKVSELPCMPSFKARKHSYKLLCHCSDGANLVMQSYLRMTIGFQLNHLFLQCLR